MNLHTDTTKEALTELIATADTKIPAHNIVIDYDGEVIIDPELHYPNVDVDRYKFCTNVKDKNLHNSEVIQVLHEVLLTIFETQSKSMGDYLSAMGIAA
jgi:hypothetical protein